MVQTCSKCSRANPAEAVYCYFDGFVLGGHGRNGGPVAVGAQVFPNPFVFPNGRTCRSFDELALACQEEWAAARDLLAQGFLEQFLGGLGRVDLANAAKEAAQFPDRDRGLDQLLAKLPSDVLAEPTLRIEPLEVNLGVVQRDTSRRFELHLENQGMRLLYGSVDAGESWLALGDPPSGSEKHFQFTHEQIIPVHVRTDKLRANTKPVEGKLLIESNAGPAVVVVRASVPVQPFPSGVLAGAASPRQVAEKAKANPREAAALFIDGSVAQWYKQNGWTYPVQGPVASGMAAVQQFFEALGLTPPPKVQISVRSIALEGKPGESLHCALEVKSDERKPIYAHGVSNEPWLEVEAARLNGRVATLPLTVRSVPDRPGETLTARLKVRSNGNQRFVVPVTLQVTRNEFDFSSLTAAPPRLAPPPVPPPVPPPAPVPTAPAADPSITSPPPLPPVRPVRRRRKGGETIPWVHLAPAALLALLLLGVLVFDLKVPVGSTATVEDGRRRLGLQYTLSDPAPRLDFKKSNNYRFGLLLPMEKDDQDQPKHLTFQPEGTSNNTCVKIDDDAGSLFGETTRTARLASRPVEDAESHYWRSSWLLHNDILVTQEVQIVPGAQSGVLDTCLVQYTVLNRGKKPHKVGLRVMFDTFIGGNDGVPFAIPGHKDLVTTPQTFGEKEVPDYLQALERPDLANPGTIAHMGLKGIEVPGVPFEPITKLVITSWKSEGTRWEPTPDPEITDPELLKAKPKDNTIKDSCVFLYWDYREMNPDEERHMAFSYGLNAISTPEGEGKLALTAGGSFTVGKEFTVTAYVKQPVAGQKVKLVLPDGLELLPDQQAEQEVTAKGDYTQVSWRVRSTKTGQFPLTATSTTGSRAAHQVRITDISLFH